MTIFVRGESSEGLGMVEELNWNRFHTDRTGVSFGPSAIEV